MLQFVHVPSDIYLPASADLRSSDVAVVTSQLIGMSAETPPGWTGYGDLLSRPKAAAVIVVNTPDHFKPELDGTTYKLTQTAVRQVFLSRQICFLMLRSIHFLWTKESLRFF